MTQYWKEPTQAEQDQALLVQNEMVELANRLRGEGLIPPIIIAGMGAAIADVLTTIYGNESVPPWFAKQAEMTDALINGKNIN